MTIKALKMMNLIFRTTKNLSSINIEDKMGDITTAPIKHSGFSAWASALLSIQFFTRWKGNFHFKPLHFIAANRCGAFPTFAHPKSTKMKNVNF